MLECLIFFSVGKNEENNLICTNEGETFSKQVLLEETNHIICSFETYLLRKTALKYLLGSSQSLALFDKLP